MTADEFRAVAMAQEGAVAGGHMGHEDFRVKKGIFATLGSPGPEWAGLKLSPEQQEMLMAAMPEAFEPASGAWGRQGWTKMRLAGVDAETGESAVRMAWGTRGGKR